MVSYYQVLDFDHVSVPVETTKVHARLFELILLYPDEKPMYSTGRADICMTLFYALLFIAIHAVENEYCWEVRYNVSHSGECFVLQ